MTIKWLSTSSLWAIPIGCCGRSQLAAATAAACDRRAWGMMCPHDFHRFILQAWNSYWFIHVFSGKKCFSFSFHFYSFLIYIMFCKSKSSYFKTRNPWKLFPYPIPNSNFSPPRPTARCATWSDPVPGPLEVTGDCSLPLFFWKNKENIWIH